MNRIVLSLLLVAVFMLDACKKDDNTCTKEVKASALADVDQTRLASDIAAIDAYLTTNGITAQSEPNGVRYVISQQGDGTTPCLESYIVVKYKLSLLKSGTVVQDNTSTAGSTFKLNGLILGWQLVLPSIKAGSKVTLYIPSGYAYGTAGGASGAIPSNANLIFEIELVSVR